MNKEQQILEFMRLHSNLESAMAMYYRFSKTKERRATVKMFLRNTLKEYAAFINKYIKLKENENKV